MGHGGFHDVLLHDMDDVDSPYGTVSDLAAIRPECLAVVLSRMVRHQLDLE